MERGERGKADVFTALGAATGLGNALRFPGLCAGYGGAFVWAYALCLALFCFPLLCAELYYGSRGKINRAVTVAASLNSALVALYYGVICSKLTCAAAQNAVYEEVADGLSLWAVAAVWVAAFALTKGGARTLSRSGKASVILSLSLFALLAVRSLCGYAPALASLFYADGGKILSLKLWRDAFGQSLLSLSLAAGVMPAFAKSLPEGFSVAKTSLAIIAANFSGCLLAAVATYPFAEGGVYADGLTTALKFYPRIVGGGVKGALFFAVLTLVSVQSLCSLALPVFSLFPKEGRARYTALFCVIGAVLTPLFAAEGCRVMRSADALTCGIIAPAVAAAEIVAVIITFASGGVKNIKGRKGI